MICYEDIIPSFARRLVAERPNLLVNITNDAWFGATSEPYEHLALAVYRAVEHRLDLEPVTAHRFIPNDTASVVRTPFIPFRSRAPPLALANV